MKKNNESKSSVKLSGLVVAHNEEDNLEACLQSIRFVDELVVVLDKCTDGSKQIAEKYADKISEGSWDIEGHRRNHGLDLCTKEWRFELDADERISPELAREIREKIENPDFSYYPVPIWNHVGGHRVIHGWAAYNGCGGRSALSRKGCKKWNFERVHPNVDFKGVEGERLQNGIIHYVDDDFADMISRLNRDTTKRAEDLIEKNVNESLGRNIRRIFSRAWKSYIARKGYKEGKYGIMLAIFAGLFPILSYLKAEFIKERQSK